MHIRNTCCSQLFPIDFLEDLENLKEEIDDVQVELNGGDDVILRRNFGHDHLCVKNDES